MSLSDLDPTGTLAAATSAIRLVGKIAQVAPALTNAGNTRNQAAGPSSLRRSTTAPISAAKKDPERERRAYETVNFVLREFGGRICAAGLVNEHALTKALVAASQHVDMKLFSGEANRLFESLAPKLADPLLVNSVFTAIYFIGVLVAELTRSLPNYRENTQLGAKLVQQLFRTAIGEGAFRENLSANLDAYETLAVTAGLLRPTDPDYATFPGFPAFSPSRYSGRSINESWGNKFAYDKLCKHLSRAGFPQPNPALQGEIGIIGDWRFLMSDTNTQSHDIDKADKTIGENFGRVLYWLVCAADRLPPGQAIVVVHDQHIELIRWIGPRLGYRILQPATDLDLTGAHMKLDGRLKSIINNWLVLIFSEPARAAKQAASEKWNQERAAAAAKMAKANPPPSPAVSPPALAPGPPQRAASATSPPSSAQSSVPNRRVSLAPAQSQSMSGMALEPFEIELNKINQWFNAQLKPQCQVFIKMPPANPQASELEAKRLVDLTEKEILFPLDALRIPDGHLARIQRKAIVDQAQQMLITVDAYAQAAGGGAPEKIPATPSSMGSTSPVPQDLHRLSISSTQTTPLTSPPPYSPGSSTGVSAAIPPKTVVPTTKIRRKAPPPPRKPTAKALYDFIPEEGDEEELAFKEGDVLEIVEKTAALEEEGWCKAKIKGTTKIGLAPLEYLEIAPIPAAAPPKLAGSAVTPSTQPTGAQSGPGEQHIGSPTSHPVASPTTQQSSQITSSQSSATTAPPAAQHPSKLGTKEQPLVAKTKLSTGGKIGVAVAGVGALTGVAALYQNQQNGNQTGSNHPHQNQQQPLQQQQQQNQNPQADQSQNQNDNQNAQQSQDQQQANTNQDPSSLQDQSSYNSQNTAIYPAETTATTTQGETYYDPAATTTSDPSALNGGFQPSDPTFTSYEPVADPVVMDPAYCSPFAAVATPPAAEGYFGGELGMASPFAGVAGSNAPAPAGSTTVMEEDVLIVETDPVTGETVAVEEEEEVYVEEDLGGGGYEDDGAGFEFE